MKIALRVRSDFRVRVLTDRPTGIQGAFEGHISRHPPKLIKSLFETNFISRVIAIPTHALEIALSREHNAQTSADGFETSPEIEEILEAVAFVLDPDGRMERVAYERLEPLWHQHIG
ncbi:MAG: hypothetical protein WCV82_02115 [Candidatus Paceibacterota bacterium]